MLCQFVPVLLAIAFMIYVERKTLAAVQRREGPSMVGPNGSLQSFIDGGKLIFKENIIPYKSNKIIFVSSSILMFCFSLLNWLIIPIGPDSVILDIEYSVFFLLLLSSFNAYCLILAGWSSNSKYALLGALRAAAQLISYEVFFGFILVPIFMHVGSMNLVDIVLAQKNVWFCFTYLPGLIIFFIAGLAETNRTPFDLPEAEAEIVAGYNVEYSGIIFAFFFLAEYNNILINSSVITCFFLGGWNLLGFSSEIFFIVKTLVCVILFILIRAILPRFRYDQLMVLGWKKLLPFTTGIVVLWITLYFWIDNSIWYG